MRMQYKIILRQVMYCSSKNLTIESKAIKKEIEILEDIHFVNLDSKIDYLLLRVGVIDDLLAQREHDKNIAIEQNKIKGGK